jgi:hypothetical protein
MSQWGFQAQTLHLPEGCQRMSSVPPVSAPSWRDGRAEKRDTTPPIVSEARDVGSDTGSCGYVRMSALRWFVLSQFHRHGSHVEKYYCRYFRIFDIIGVSNDDTETIYCQYNIVSIIEYSSYYGIDRRIVNI